MGSVGTIDLLTLLVYFVIVVTIGFIKGRGKRESSKSFFIAKSTLPWWVIGATFVATGMNTEQLVGMNGMAYRIGLPLLNWFYIVIFVYSLLIFIFLPVYLRNNIMTMPEYLGRRFDSKCQDIFTVILLLSYVFMNLAVVFYGGGKLLEVIFGINIWIGVLVIGLVAGLYTMYGGMSSAAYAAVFQFGLIFLSGFYLMFLAYMKLPNGWSDVVAAAPCGFHMIQPSDYPEIPWQAVPLTILGIHLYYSCANQALVQGCFGAKTEWDARIGLIAAGMCVSLRPFVEVFPGLFCRAIGVVDPSFNLENQPVDNVLPVMIRQLVPIGFQGLILVGILASVMSTISAFLNSISTLFTMNVYKRWINHNADEHRLVKVGTIVTCILMIFSILYSPMIGYLSGGIFSYFQTLASYITVPLATVFLLGVLWKRATATSAFAILVLGIPLGLIVSQIAVPNLFDAETIRKWSLSNPFITGAMTQVICVVLMIGISLITKPKPVEEVRPLTFSLDKLYLPPGEPHRPFYQKVCLWWGIMVVFYAFLYWLMW
ncbi:MAG: sodium/solute symporter [Planctomycetia bacterium]|nr:sodium/solute symporter [Planctomycetia bacterium]